MIKVMQVRGRIRAARNEKIFLPWAVIDCSGEYISMEKRKNKSYLQTYYGANQAASCPMRIVLNKIERPALKGQKKKKGLYALGSN